MVLEGPRLLDLSKTPPHLQFNTFVLTGYRPVSTARECVSSLLYLHNESGNIYTHGIPFLCFLVLLPLSLPWGEVSTRWMCVVHYLACLSPTVGSLLYHLFMNHQGGAPIYHTLLSLDMVGVCLVNTLGALPIVHVTLLCYPITRGSALLSYCVLSAYGIHVAVTANSNFRRLRSFLWQFLFRLALFLLRWTGRGVGSPASLRLFVTMEVLALAGGVVNVSQVPERFWPGGFDLWGNSHQLMHLLVVLSILYLHWGQIEDLEYLKTYQCPTE